MAKDQGRLQDHFGLLLVLLVASFLLTGLTEDDWLKTLSAVVNGLTLLVAFRATSLRTDYTRLAAAGSAAIAGIVAAVVVAGEGGDALLAACQLIVLTVLFLAIIQRVLRHERVSAQTLFGALCAYVLLGLMYTWAYVGASFIGDEPSFDGGSGLGDAVYLSYITLTTVGFGDITPVSEVARRIAMVEAMTGQIFLATLVARLVSLYGRGRAEEPAA
jgi:hypothetical protein